MSIRYFLYLFIASFLFASNGWADVAGQAKVLEVQGEAKFLRPGTSEWAALEKNMILSEGDSVKTARESQVRLELSGGAKMGEVLVREESQFKLATLRHDQAKKTENTLLDVEIGNVLVKAEKLDGDSKFEVKTPTSIVGVRGTTFEVQVSKES